MVKNKAEKNRSESKSYEANKDLVKWIKKSRSSKVVTWANNRQMPYVYGDFARWIRGLKRDIQRQQQKSNGFNKVMRSTPCIYALSGVFNHLILHSKAIFWSPYQFESIHNYELSLSKRPTDRPTKPIEPQSRVIDDNLSILWSYGQYTYPYYTHICMEIVVLGSFAKCWLLYRLQNAFVISLNDGMPLLLLFSCSLFKSTHRNTQKKSRKRWESWQ